MAKAGAGTRIWENPLLPHARLREIYTRMVETRALAARLRLRGVREQEACLVTATLSLQAEDLTFEAARGGLTPYLRGERLREVVRGDFSGAKQAGVARAGVRAWAAVGAAVGLKAADGKAVALAYLESGELENSAWRDVLGFAGREALPLVFVVLSRGGGGESGLGEEERGCGVPCLGVDAQDAVALYRAVQESLGRARAGGGAALLECVRFPVVEGLGDAITRLGESLVKRGLVTEAWRRRVGERFASKLANLAQD